MIARVLLLSCALMSAAATAAQDGRSHGEAMAAFRSAPPAQRQAMLARARQRAAELEREAVALERHASDQRRVFSERVQKLRETLGPNAALFGYLQQVGEDLSGQLRGSATRLDARHRRQLQWLDAFSARMSRSSDLFTTADLRSLWRIVIDEARALGAIAHLQVPVLDEDGQRRPRAVYRIGPFALVSVDPEPAYLSFNPQTGRVGELRRQPDARHLALLEDWARAGAALAPISLDPTGGSLLARLVDAPSLTDRIAQGGLIGNLILALGAVGITLAMFKLLWLLLLQLRVAAQRRRPEVPDAGNPLGRVLLACREAAARGPEALEVRLGECLLEERPRVERGIGLLKVIAAVAPLMGLMGTVIGMIQTFQAITMFGAGDPKTMAGGISQALVTTVEGLSVAIPMVLLHALASARAAAIIDVLRHESAALLARRMLAQEGSQ